jgi:hypothetical protein
MRGSLPDRSSETILQCAPVLVGIARLCRQGVIPIACASADHAVYFIVGDKPKRTHTGLKRLRKIEHNPPVALTR